MAAMSQPSLSSHLVTDEQTQVRPSVVSGAPKADDELFAFDKQIAELELQLEALRMQRRQALVARQRNGMAAWRQTEHAKEECKRTFQRLKDAFRDARVRRAQASDQWDEHHCASGWGHWCWARSSSSGSAETSAASTWTTSDWNTWRDSWKESAWRAEPNGSS
jgi:hypothetical protein